jgi:hypothetical protein
MKGTVQMEKRQMVGQSQTMPKCLIAERKQGGGLGHHDGPEAMSGLSFTHMRQIAHVPDWVGARTKGWLVSDSTSEGLVTKGCKLTDSVDSTISPGMFQE